jgi:hypothetical protein
LGVVVVFVVVECAAHGFDGVALEAGPDVGVDVCGDVELGMAEEFFDGDEFVTG